MEWSIVAGRPVYLQLIEQLELAIVVGEYPPGEKIPRFNVNRGTGSLSKSLFDKLCAVFQNFRKF